MELRSDVKADRTNWRLPQYSIRTLLILTLLLAVGLSYWKVHQVRVESQLAVLKSFESARPEAWDWDSDGYVRSLTMRIGDAIKPSEWSRLRELPRLKDLYVYGLQNPDTFLSVLDGVPDLESLRIDCRSIDWLTNGQSSLYPESNVSDQSVRILGALAKIRTLEVFGPRINDSQLELIATARNLRFLSIPCAQCSITGVTKLTKLPRLIRASIGITENVAEGQRDLQAEAELPNFKLEVIQNGPRNRASLTIQKKDVASK